MRSTTPSLHHFEQTADALEAVAYISIATDLLQRIFFELLSLSTTNANLAVEMAHRESQMHDRLWALSQIADDLSYLDDRSLAITLIGQGMALISSLSADFDELTAGGGIDELRARLDGSTLH